MVEPMDIDHNGVSDQATPVESVTEDSLKREETPESTEVPSSLQILVAVDANNVGWICTRMAHSRVA